MTDKCSPTVVVTMKVRDLRGRTVVTWHAGSVATGVVQAYQTTITLDRGFSSLEFDAVDLGGNQAGDARLRRADRALIEIVAERDAARRRRGAP